MTPGKISILNRFLALLYKVKDAHLRYIKRKPVCFSEVPNNYTIIYEKYWQIVGVWGLSVIYDNFT